MPILSEAQYRHASLYLSLLQDAEKRYRQGGTDQLEGLAIFSTNLSNIQVGQSWAEKHLGSNRPADTLFCGYLLARIEFDHNRLHPQEHIRSLQHALDLIKDLRELPTFMALHNNLGAAYARLGLQEEAASYYQMALAMTRGLDLPEREAEVLTNLGLVYVDQEKLPQAIECYERALTLDRAVGNRWGEAFTLCNLGLAYAELGEFPRAVEFYQSALALDRETGNRQGEGATIGNLGSAYRYLGEADKARECHEQQLDIAYALADRYSQGNALGNLGILCAEQEEWETAIAYFNRQLECVQVIGDKYGEENALHCLARIYDELGDDEQFMAHTFKLATVRAEMGDTESIAFLERLQQVEASKR